MATIQLLRDWLVGWLVPLLLLFVILGPAFQWIRVQPQRLLARLICRLRAKHLRDGECFLAVALPSWWMLRLRRAHFFSEMDTFGMGRVLRLHGPILTMEEVTHEWRVVSRLKWQIANYVWRHQRGVLFRCFDWVGFTGAARVSRPRFYIYSVRNENSVCVFEAVAGRAGELWRASLRERIPTAVKPSSLTWDQKVEEAMMRRKEACEKIAKRPATTRFSKDEAILVEEAMIAGSLADSAGEALRILNAIGDPKTSEAYARQVPIAISHVYPSRG